ncbi:hypothetical protein [Salipiger abyssi]|uniref:hypothetical protein n=1 Tax=Salipiger abyssi TaxID=1250539 RepID=UPI001A8D26AC|nr:hypothetical protein [Salipiger abyssi]MBN9887700.1 hypothetical protein [Salipiger abyssi]
MDQSPESLQRMRKSNVRIVVTYFVVFVYSLSAVGFSTLLFIRGEYELALGIFNGLATLSAGIAGFWFGSRGEGFPHDAPGAAGEAQQDNLIGGEEQKRRRAVNDDGDDPDCPPISNV